MHLICRNTNFFYFELNNYIHRRRVTIKILLTSIRLSEIFEKMVLSRESEPIKVFLQNSRIRIDLMFLENHQACSSEMMIVIIEQEKISTLDLIKLTQRYPNARFVLFDSFKKTIFTINVIGIVSNEKELAQVLKYYVKFLKNKEKIKVSRFESLYIKEIITIEIKDRHTVYTTFDKKYVYQNEALKTYLINYRSFFERANKSVIFNTIHVSSTKQLAEGILEVHGRKIRVSKCLIKKIKDRLLKCQSQGKMS